MIFGIIFLCGGVAITIVGAFSYEEFESGPNFAMDRIVNGRVVDIEDYPYQVGLVAQHRNRKRIICGGALIKPKVVFTAAHCTHTRNDDQRENLAVLVGANYLGDPNGHLHKIERVIKHPDFSYHDLDHDFSVLVLQDPVKFGSNVREIPVSTKDNLGGTEAVASGWGLTEFGAPSKYLRATELTVEQWNKCQDYFPGSFHPKITPNMICVKADSKTTYFGDSGGPLVIDGELVGLVSFGRKIGRNKKTTVFTRVKNFLDFVEESLPEFRDY